MSTYRHPYKVLPQDQESRCLDKELIVDFVDEKLYVRDATNSKSILIETPDISTHIIKTDNPHKVNVKDIKLSLVENKKQASVVELNTHIADKNNPHQVTKEDIGLGLVTNIESISKQEYNDMIRPVQKQIEKVGQYFESIVDKLGLEKHTLTIVTTPADADVKVLYNGYLHNGKSHDLYIGIYDYELSVPDMLPITGKLRMMNDDTTVSLSIAANVLTINTIPEDAIVEVLIDGIWEEGKSHLVKEGTYQYRVSREHYESFTHLVEVGNSSLVLEVELVINKYNLFLDVTPPGANIEVEFDGVYHFGDTFELPFGLYNYRITKDRFKSVQSTAMLDKDTVIPITLEEAAFIFTINIEPEDAVVEVYYNNTWNAGKTHSVEFGTYPVQATLPGYKTTVVYIDVNSDTVIDVTMEEEIYSLIILPTPANAIVEVYYNDQWNMEPKYLLPNGIYRYNVIADNYITKSGTVTINSTNVSLEVKLDHVQYPINFITTPVDALVEVKVDGVWISGHTQNLALGSYEYRVSKDHYVTNNGYITVEQSNPDITIELEEILYNISFNTNPVNTEIEIDGITGYIFQLKAGDYNYTASSTGYTTITDILTVDGDSNIDLTLVPIEYNLTINPTPVDATVEVFYDGIWNTGVSHTLISGAYPVKVSKPGYELIEIITDIFGQDSTIDISLVLKEVTLSIIVDSITEPLIEVFYNGIWNSGKDHTLLAGTYDYRISASYYINTTDSIEILDNTILPITLTPTEYTVNITVDPIDADVVITNLNNNTIYPNNSIMPYGNYEYTISKDLYTTVSDLIILNTDTNINIVLEETKYNLSFIVSPPDALITVTGIGYSGTGNNQNLLPGTYDYTISMESIDPGGFVDYTGSVEILADNVEIIATLTKLKFRLDFQTTPDTALVEVFYNGIWNIGYSHRLIAGIYDYRISEAGYTTLEESVDFTQDTFIQRTLTII